MTRYLNEKGERTNESDPERLLWHSASCTYWTDDFDALNTEYIPTCPKCGSPGYQVLAKKWDEAVEHFERKYPGYTALMVGLQEQCLPAFVFSCFEQGYKKLRLGLHVYKAFAKQRDAKSRGDVANN